MTTMQGNGSSIRPGVNPSPVQSVGSGGGEAAPQAEATSGPLALCPYCGHRQTGRVQCDQCKGLFEPLSRQATQNAMGPWFIRDEANPFRPGCSQQKLVELVAKGRITRETVLRGPGTRQFWTLACCAPGVAVHLGECHACHARVNQDEFLCRSCGVTLDRDTDRQYLGLAPVKLLPGAASAGEVASSGMLGAYARPTSPVAETPALVSPAEPAEVETSPESRLEVEPRRHGAWPMILLALCGVIVIGGALAAVIFLAPSSAVGG